MAIANKNPDTANAEDGVVDYCGCTPTSLPAPSLPDLIAGKTALGTVAVLLQAAFLRLHLRPDCIALLQASLLLHLQSLHNIAEIEVSQRSALHQHSCKTL